MLQSTRSSRMITTLVLQVALLLPMLTTSYKLQTLKQRPFSNTLLRCIGKELTPIPPPTNLDPNVEFWQTIHNPNIIPVKREKFAVRPEIITFDAMNTLIQPSQSIGRWYREALNTACDMKIRLPRPILFAQSFKTAFSKMSQKYPCFGAKSAMSCEEWWYKVVEETYMNTKV